MKCFFISGTITCFVSAAVHPVTRKQLTNLLAVLLYVLSTRVGKIHAHASLIHVHSSGFLMHSFLLTLNDPFWWPTHFAWER
jgi:hypothetical protein